jgi:hypothetical protein
LLLLMLPPWLRPVLLHHQHCRSLCSWRLLVLLLLLPWGRSQLELQ